MQIHRGYWSLPQSALHGVVAIGNFDGVHRGHRALIEAARERARELGAPLGVITFEPHPREVGDEGLLTRGHADVVRSEGLRRSLFGDELRQQIDLRLDIGGGATQHAARRRRRLDIGARGEHDDGGDTHKTGQFSVSRSQGVCYL